MQRPRKINGEIWLLLGLFVFFLVFVAYYERVGQEITPPSTPSSFSARSLGVKALYLLLEQQGYAVSRLEAPWHALSPEDRLLIVVEPTDNTRPISHEEVDSLKRWVINGGTVLYFVTSPPRPLDPSDTVFGDMEVIAGSVKNQQITPARRDSPLLRDVAQVAVKSPVRLKCAPHSRCEVLFRDSQGALALVKNMGKGRAIAVANDGGISNGVIKDADNAVFLVNIAAAATETKPGNILFDEYHHGVGFADSRSASQAGLLASVPVPLRLALWHILGLSALVLFNGNRRFGRPRLLSAPANRPGTDYVHSMARLFRRAGASDIAITTLYRRFLRDLALTVDAPPNMNPQQIGQRAERLHHLEEGSLQSLIVRCESMSAGERLNDAATVEIARQLEEFRRRCHLVGI